MDFEILFHILNLCRFSYFGNSICNLRSPTIPPYYHGNRINIIYSIEYHSLFVDNYLFVDFRLYKHQGKIFERFPCRISIDQISSTPLKDVNLNKYALDWRILNYIKKKNIFMLNFILNYIKTTLYTQFYTQLYKSYSLKEI